MTGSLVGAALLAVVVGGLSEATYADGGPVVYALDTRKIPGYKDPHPTDVQTLMTMDPSKDAAID